MKRDESDVRRAYERGRLVRALPFALLPIPLIVISESMCGAPVSSCVTGGLLMLLIVFFAWRGQALEAAITPGLGAGLGAFAVPFIGLRLGFDDPMACATICGVGGLVAAGILAAQMRRRLGDQTRFLAAACSITVFVGALGCVLAGFAGVLGMLLGVTIVSGPVLLLKRA